MDPSDELVEACNYLSKGVNNLIHNVENLDRQVVELEDIRKRESKKHLFNVGKHVNTFVGRELILEQIKTCMESGREQNQLVSHAVAVCGLGGVGKTQLAKKYANKFYCDNKLNAVWINGDNTPALKNSFQQAAKALDIPIYTDEETYTERPLQKVALDVYQTLPGQNTLFIFDNVDNHRIIYDFLPWILVPHQVSPSVLITSRNSNWNLRQEFKIHVIKLKTFESQEALMYVKDSVGIKDSTYDQDISTLSKSLMFFPLALSQAAAWIRMRKIKTSEIDIKLYCEKFRHTASDAVDKIEAFSYKHRHEPYKNILYTTWKLTFDTIKDNIVGSRALELINTMAFISPDYILVEKFFLESDEKEDQFWCAFDLLDQYSILQIYKGVATVHRLVQEVLRLWIKEGGENEYYLDKVSKMKFLWDWQNLYYDKMLRLHVNTFLEFASNYENILKNLFGEDKHLSFIIVQSLAENDNKNGVENIFKYLKNTCEDFADLNSHTLKIAARSGSTNILDLIGPKDLKWKYCAAVVAAGWIGRHNDLRNLLNDLGDTRDEIINTEMFDMSIDISFNIADTMAIEVKYRTEMDTALNFAATIEDVKLVKILLEFGADVTKECVTTRETALHRACRQGNVDIVTLLIEAGASISVPRCKFITPLYEAVKENNVEVISYLLEVAKEKNIQSFGGEHSLSIAVYKKQTRNVRALVESGIDVNFSTSIGRTPLHTACIVGDRDIVTKLVAHGALVNVLSKERKTPLYHAVERNNAFLVSWLLRNGARIKISDDDESDPIHVAAQLGSMKIVEILLNENNCNIRDKFGRTPLHIAASWGKLDVVKMLISVGANTYIRDGNGRRPIDQARVEKKKRVIAFLENVHGHEHNSL